MDCGGCDPLSPLLRSFAADRIDRAIFVDLLGLLLLALAVFVVVMPTTFEEQGEPDLSSCGYLPAGGVLVGFLGGTFAVGDGLIFLSCSASSSGSHRAARPRRLPPCSVRWHHPLAMPSSETCGGRMRPCSSSVPRSARRSAPVAQAVGHGRCSFSSPADLSRPGCRSFCADHPDGRAIAELSCRRPAEEGCCSRSRREGVMARCDRTQRRPRPRPPSRERSSAGERGSSASNCSSA